MSVANIMSLKNRRGLQDIMFLYKLLNDKIYSPELLSKVNFRVDIKNTRSKFLFTLNRPRTDIGKFSPNQRMMKLGNIASCAGVDVSGPCLLKDIEALFEDIISCSIVLLASLWVILIWKRRKLYYISWQIPGPFALPYIGNALIYFLAGSTNSLHSIPWCMEKYGKSKLVRVWIAGDLHILITDATATMQINKLVLKKGGAEELVQPLLEKGIFTDRDIPHWKVSRKIVAQIFHFKVLKHYIPIFHDETLKLMEKLQKLSNSEASFYPPKLMELLTFGSILRTSLGVNYHIQEKDSHPITDAMNRLLEHFQTKVLVPPLTSNFLYSLIGRRHAELRDIKMLDLFAQDILKKLNESKDSVPRKPLPELLLEHSEISEEEIRAQIATIFLAGTDTTTHSDSVILLVLAVLPEVQSKVYNEVIEIFGEDFNVCPSYEDLMRLDYTDRFIKEVLRLFPAGFYAGKKSTQDIRVTTDDKREYTFPAGVQFLLLIHMIHRSPDYYENPLAFDPDRWLPEKVENRHPFCYLPFSSGPRNCVAGKYALLQMKTLLATLVRRFEFLPSDNVQKLDDIKVRIRLTLSLQKQCEIKVRLRK